ncbi:MAG: copper-binding protein [Phycisphaerales bacterium]
MPRSDLRSSEPIRGPRISPAAAPRLVECAAALLLVACCVAACSREPASPNSTPGATGKAAAKPLTPPDYVHFVRGRIEQLPEEGKPVNSLQIHHEPIEAWVRPDGRLGMNSMIMGFNPADTVDLKKFTVGDLVEFRWEVRKRANGPSLITEMNKLPPETELNFGRAGGG